jgi:phage-related protein (TIGR01555 family)
MGFWDALFGRKPALPAPVETPAERARREIMAAAAVLESHGIDPLRGPRRDSLASATMGLGDLNLDKRETIRPARRGFFSLDELDTLYMQGGLFRRLSEAPAVDAVSRGWRTDDARQQDITSALDRRLKIKKRMIDALRYARAYGRSHLIMVTDDGAPMSEPLPPGKHRVLQLQPFMRREMIPFQWSMTMGTEAFAEAEVELWQLQPIRIGVFVPTSVVHGSRVITLRGLDSPLTPIGGFDLGRGLSVPDAYWEEIRDIVAVWGSLATSALEMSIPVVTLGAHLDAATGGDAPDYAAALRFLAMSRSAFRMTVKSGSDLFERDNVAFTGIKEVITALQERICALEGIAATRIFGQSPGGLSTDDASGRATYNTFIGGIREDKVDPAVQRIYEVELGPGDRSIVWAPIEVPTAREQAEVDDILARRDATLIAAKVITPAESRARYEGDEVLPSPVVVGEYDDDADDLELDEVTAEAAEVEGLDEIEEVDETDEREDAETYAVPEAARNNARRVLEWRKKHGSEVKGMTSVGWRRARQLASNARVGYETVAAMAAFNRHRKNAEVAEEYKSEPWKDAGYVAWLGWGGTTGIDWARKITGAADE